MIFTKWCISSAISSAKIFQILRYRDCFYVLFQVAPKSLRLMTLNLLWRPFLLFKCFLLPWCSLPPSATVGLFIIFSCRWWHPLFPLKLAYGLSLTLLIDTLICWLCRLLAGVIKTSSLIVFLDNLAIAFWNILRKPIWVIMPFASATRAARRLNTCFHLMSAENTCFFVSCVQTTGAKGKNCEQIRCFEIWFRQKGSSVIYFIHRAWNIHFEVFCVIL